LCPSLHIESSSSSTTKKEELSDAATISAEADRRRNKIVEDGFVLVDDPLDDERALTQLRQGIQQLHDNHHPHHQPLPATFILLFDETWELARKSKKVLASACHKQNHFNFDILAWYIEPGTAGFSPHRDRQPADAVSSFHADDRQAKFVTQWIALSEATPQNSCLYVIPKPHDPGYVNGDTEEEDPLRRALPNKEAFPHIRALPRTIGQSILFTHRIIHWGSKSEPETTDARIAISFVCSDPTFEAPLVKPEYFSDERLPPFHIRLLLVCAQLLIYYQRFALSKEAIKLCYEYCKEHELELEENYRRKVFYEFVRAMKEHTQQITSASAASSSSSSKDGVKLVITEEGDEEDDEDAMMEEMLNAETGGYGEFEDDYDELEEEDVPSDNGQEDNDDVDDDEEDFDLNATFVKSDSSGPPAKKVKMI
jgi:hypothetical protein